MGFIYHNIIVGHCGLILGQQQLSKSLIFLELSEYVKRNKFVQ